MNDKLPFSLGQGTVFDGSRVYVVAFSSREEGARIFRWTGQWDNYYVGAIAAAICSVRSPEPEIVTLCADGTVHTAGPAGFSEIHIDPSPEGPEHRGVLRDLRSIGNRLFATGLGRQVYERRPDNNWVRCDDGVVEALGGDAAVGFESIDGFSPDEIYATGHGGEIWKREEGKWVQLNSPTNTLMITLLCAPDQQVYIAGRHGMILRGRQDSWEVVHQGLTDETFWDSTWYGGCLWLATHDGLYVLDGDLLTKVELGLGKELTFGYIDAADDELWSFGERDLIRFDGIKWAPVPGF